LLIVAPADSSYSTVALPDTKFTSARLTPGILHSCFSTPCAQSGDSKPATSMVVVFMASVLDLRR